MVKFFKKNKITCVVEDILMKNSTEVRVNDFLFEHAKSMVANCVAKSEIYTIYKNKNVKEDMYYLLNVRPNPNQTATEFWLSVVDKYFSQNGEVLIVNVGDYLYIADSYSKSSDVLSSKTFSNVSIVIDYDELRLNKVFNKESSILIRRNNKKIDDYTCYVNDKISEVMICVLNSYKKLQSKYVLEIPNQRIQSESGELITKSELAKSISDDLSNSEVNVINLPSQIKLEEIKNSLNNGISTSDFNNIFEQAAKNVAMAFNIPVSAFLGNITEKSDAFDEFVTMACQIVTEQISDALNFFLMSKKSYLEGSEIRFNLSSLKHRDLLENASSIDKLVAVGFSHNDILNLFGMPLIDEPWANDHNLTKNYGPINSDMKGGDK